jgi:hypothetical protein
LQIVVCCGKRADKKCQCWRVAEFFLDLLAVDLETKLRELTVNRAKTLTVKPLPFLNYVLRTRGRFYSVL